MELSVNVNVAEGSWNTRSDREKIEWERRMEDGGLGVFG